MTREEWLAGAVSHLRPLIERAEVEGDLAIKVPRVWVSVGWPKGHRGRGRAIGQCWDGTQSTDRAPHVFISPELAIADVVLATLTHELIHAALPGAKHRGRFVEVARAVGLVRPWTATTAGPELGAELAKMAGKLGKYPHASLAPLAATQKPGSRLRLWVCECGVRVRVASDVFMASCLRCGREFKRQ